MITPRMGRRNLGMGRPVLGLALLVAASGARAAEQGSIGIHLTILPHAQIDGPDDIRFGGLEGQAPAPQGVCLSSNAFARSYTVAAIGSGQGGAFEMSNGSDSIAYTVEWSSREQAPAGAVTLGESTRAELDAAASQAECALGSGSADLAIVLDPAQARAIQSGAPYTGTLTLIVSPK